MASGYTASLPADIILDAGLLYLANTLIAATRGGLRFNPGIEMRNVEFDGKRSDIGGLDRVTLYAPTIEGTLIEFGATEIGYLMPGAGVSVVGGVTTITPIDASVLITNAQLLTNLRALWPRGSGGFAEVNFPKAICTQFGLEGEDNSEVGVPCTFAARLDMSVGGAVTDDAPYRIRLISAITD